MQPHSPAVPAPQSFATLALRLVFFTAALILVSAVALYYPVQGGVLLGVVLPVGALIAARCERFEAVKIATLLAGRVLVVAAALSLIDGPLLGTFVTWLLRLNIAEASVKDFTEGRRANALSGLVLILTTWGLDVQWNGVWYYTTNHAFPLWIAAYTLWNWNFVNQNFPAPISRYHLGVLAAPILFSLWLGDASPWLAMRGVTLTLAGVIQVSLKEGVLRSFGGEAPLLPRAGMAQYAVVALVLLACGLSTLGG